MEIAQQEVAGQNLIIRYVFGIIFYCDVCTDIATGRGGIGNVTFATDLEFSFKLA